MREKERAKQMIEIMIDRIDTASNDEQMQVRQYRAAGAIFILYVIDIITLEEHNEYDKRIFHRTAF